MGSPDGCGGKGGKEARMQDAPYLVFRGILCSEGPVRPALTEDLVEIHIPLFEQVWTHSNVPALC